MRQCFIVLVYQVSTESRKWLVEIDLFALCVLKLSQS